MKTHFIVIILIVSLSACMSDSKVEFQQELRKINEQNMRDLSYEDIKYIKDFIHKKLKEINSDKQGWESSRYLSSFLNNREEVFLNSDYYFLWSCGQLFAEYPNAEKETVLILLQKYLNINKAAYPPSIKDEVKKITEELLYKWFDTSSTDSLAWKKIAQYFVQNEKNLKKDSKTKKFLLPNEILP